MTPCEKFGYKVGDKFTVTCGEGEDRVTSEQIKYGTGFTVGQVITLAADDGSDSPCFVGRNAHFNNGPQGEDGAYINLTYVVPYVEGEQS